MSIYVDLKETFDTMNHTILLKQKIDCCYVLGVLNVFFDHIFLIVHKDIIVLKVL